MLVLFSMNGEAILQRFGNMQAVTSDKEGRWKGGETRTGFNQTRQCGRRVRRGKILNSSELRRCKWHTVAYVCMREAALRFNFAAMMDSSRADRQKEKSFDWKQTRPSRAQRMPFVRFRHCRTNPPEIFPSPLFPSPCPCTLPGNCTAERTNGITIDIGAYSVERRLTTRMSDGVDPTRIRG